MNNKTAIIAGKKNIDCLTIEKEKRIKVKAIDHELNITDTVALLRMLHTDKEQVYKKECKKALEQKIAGYKSQDVRKKIHNPETLINIYDVKEKLLTSSLQCYYCKKTVKIMYRMVRDPLQWTLDRIDNTLSHTVENTIISCLSCNLKRRTIHKDKFVFSQNIKIIKTE